MLSSRCYTNLSFRGFSVCPAHSAGDGIYEVGAPTGYLPHACVEDRCGAALDLASFVDEITIVACLGVGTE